ncbi:MAG: undecaprenyl/decaprenyl-phosphate alpha-N-acetylglucosaminyl 1-phosphate transferase [Rikenellaceae bacterium]|nr:undecaprenyl/decaprenyl-phosphate alpha-N-acetylglucosaminyl 1-phosphate transferase [Rikenellaceae bacterium]
MEHWFYILPFVVAAMAVFVVHPSLVKIAHMKSIVDNPDARKLNKVPVPVLGGVAVFFGIMFSLSIAGYYIDGMNIQFELIIAMMIMLYTGVGDDILQLSPRLRFALQIFVVCLMMFLCGIYIDDFHGLWGVGELPWYVAVALTIFSCVGIINSINLIDGVDGLCSGYGVFASMMFAVCFMLMGDVSYAVLAFAVAGAIFPFMLHNMFGEKYKMFLGDGGSLVLGFICSLYVMRIIQSGDDVVSGSTISFTLAVLSIPVFDTVRVMVARIINHRSPFSPDKTHLHHMFISLGYSHVITAINIIMLNGAIVLIWHMCNLLHLSPEVQLYVTIASGLLATSGLYYGVAYLEKNKPERYAALQRFAQKYTIHRTGVLVKIQNFLDR